MAPRVRVEGWKVPASRWCKFLPARALGYLVDMEADLTEELDEEEQLVRRHRKEKKELKLLGNLTNSPMKNRERRQNLTNMVFITIDCVAVNISNLVLENQPPRISKAQKRREKKAALEKEREERIAEAEIENLSGARHVESEKLAQILAARQLEIKQIPSDGHCMYRAIEDQLKEQDETLTVVALRCQTAGYMQSHVEDFLPFLTNPNTGDMYTPGNLFFFTMFCCCCWSLWFLNKLRALSHILETPIEIIQADSPPIVVGEEYPKKPLILVYMRHAYGLGEHYNSVTRLVNTATENCS
uniref:ubiquitinyl hydrolase 1 n=1 Tax=Propithecus coquereli TaxID=379532 RepID=A0A2K6EMA4_PROCO